MAIMQVTNKEIDLQNNNIGLTLVDTAYEEQTKLIGADEGITLETVVDADNFEIGLLHDIKIKQDALYTKFEAYITLIVNYAASCSFGSIPSFTGYTYTFVTLGSEINADKPTNNELKNKLIQNELYFKERRERISAALWWIKTKQEERITMALGDILINMTGVTKYAVHAGQSKIAVSMGIDGTGTDTSFVRTPYFGGYNGTGDIAIPIETGARIEYETGSTLAEVENANIKDPDINSVVWTTGSFGTSYEYARIKLCFHNGLVNELYVQKGVAVTGSPQFGAYNTTAIYLAATNPNFDTIQGAAGSTVRFTTDRTAPTAASTVLSNHVASSDEGVAEFIRATIPSNADTRFNAETKFFLPLGGRTADLPMTLIFDTASGSKTLELALIGTPGTIEFTLDGKRIIAKYSTTLQVIDVDDWGVSPIYKPYDMLTLDDLIRVYP